MVGYRIIISVPHTSVWVGFLTVGSNRPTINGGVPDYYLGTPHFSVGRFFDGGKQQTHHKWWGTELSNRTATVMERILLDAEMRNENTNSYFKSDEESSTWCSLST